jgi:tetratricopeptide (TPR) repeat protein
MWANLQWGRLERCVAHCDAGFQLAAHIGVPPVQYGSLKALALIGLGRYGEALDALQLEVADDDHPFGRACRDLGLARLQLDLLAYEQAAETSRDVIEQARRVSRQWIEEMAQESLSLALLHGGKPDQINAHPAMSPSTTLAAEMLLARGEFEAALQCSRAAAEEAWAAEHVPVYVAAGEISARILLALEGWDEVVALCTDTLALARHHGYRPVIWRLEGHRATALKRCGRHDEAQESRRNAIEVIRELASNTSDVGLRRAFMTNTTVRSVVEGT